MSSFQQIFGVVWQAFDLGITVFGFTITFKEVMVFSIVVTMIFRFVVGFIRGDNN